MVRNAVLSAFAVASLATTVHSSPIQTDLGFPEDTNSNFPAAIGGSKGHFPIGSALGQAATSMSSDSRFNSRIYADFSGVSSGQDVESMLAEHDLFIATYDVPDQPVSRKYQKSNVAFGTGQLEMTVSAYSGSGPVLSSAIVSNQYFKYGSTRVNLKATAVEGICIGHFFYESDEQETDIEILTSTMQHSSAHNKAGIWYTNQATAEGKNKSATNHIPDYDPAAGFHEYRIDWTPDETVFYVDGTQTARWTSNVPSKAAQYLLNGWSSGDPGWSAGPPESDGTFAIKSIEILYDYQG